MGSKEKGTTRIKKSRRENILNEVNSANTTPESKQTKAIMNKVNRNIGRKQDVLMGNRKARNKKKGLL